MPALERSNLHVEGIDDVYTIKHLLLRHGIDCPVDDKRPDGEFSDRVPIIKAAGDRLKVLEAMSTAPLASINKSVGFVLDADDKPASRWNAVRDKFRKFQLNLPEKIPEDGFIDEITELRARVGVWLMPNNQRSGALEDFLQDLVDKEDNLIPLAIRSTEKAKTKGAGFADKNRKKAVLHAWLAWQKEPGQPYGIAIKAKYFRDDSHAAIAFIEWYKKLFDVG